MSSELAKQYHSINIGEKNTWDDWHLVPTSRPLVAAPRVKTSFVDLPGADGSIDLTTALSGRPTYQRRQGSWEFLVMNDYNVWHVLYSEIMYYLQGKEFQIVLDDDPGYFYLGRVAVNQWRSDKNWSKIVINYNLDPYKRSSEGYEGNWLWDPFNFETGVIKNYKYMEVNGTLVVSYIVDMLEISPSFDVAGVGLTVTYNNETYSLEEGINHFEDIVLQPGEHIFTFSGNGTVTIDSSGGRL